MEIISAEKAIKIMRELKSLPGSYFKMMHLTYNRKKNDTSGIRLVEKCRLRAALPKEAFQTDSDHYLTYTDLENEKVARQCFKKLILKVAFPPDFVWMKVKWFIK